SHQDRRLAILFPPGIPGQDDDLISAAIRLGFFCRSGHAAQGYPTYSRAFLLLFLLHGHHARRAAVPASHFPISLRFDWRISQNHKKPAAVRRGWSIVRLERA